jgi:uncharacterized protein YkwD
MSGEEVPSIGSIPLALDDLELERVMLEAINRDRQEQGLAPVAWDRTAAYAGALHAADMAAHDFFSHWNREGYGPQYRYTRAGAGGRDRVMENIYTSSARFSDGRPAPIEDFVEEVHEGQVNLMDSPGHRQNILTPEHTHVGVGFAYNPQAGRFVMAQEFVNRYVEMEPLPEQGPVGTRLLVVGRLLEGASQPNINLTYQPFPKPMSVAELNETGTYEHAAEIYQPVRPRVFEDGSFEAQVVLDYRGQAGVYSVRVWVGVQGQEVLASEWMVDVE